LRFGGSRGEIAASALGGHLSASPQNITKIIEVGDQVRIVSKDEFQGFLGTVTQVEADEQGVGLITVMFQGQTFGGVEDFGPEEVELLGSNMFREHEGH
jgi:hypothetical protein